MAPRPGICPCDTRWPRTRGSFGPSRRGSRLALTSSTYSWRSEISTRLWKAGAAWIACGSEVPGREELDRLRVGFDTSFTLGCTDLLCARAVSRLCRRAFFALSRGSHFRPWSRKTSLRRRWPPEAARVGPRSPLSVIRWRRVDGQGSSRATWTDPVDQLIEPLLDERADSQGRPRASDPGARKWPSGIAGAPEWFLRLAICLAWVSRCSAQHCLGRWCSGQSTSSPYPPWPSSCGDVVDALPCW